MWNVPLCHQGNIMNKCKGSQASPTVRSYPGTAKPRLVGGHRDKEEEEALVLQITEEGWEGKGYLKHTLGWSILDVLEGENILLGMIIKHFDAPRSKKACKTLPIRKQKTPLFSIGTKLHSHLPLTPSAILLPKKTMVLESPGTSCSSPWHSGDQTQFLLMGTCPSHAKGGLLTMRQGRWWWSGAQVLSPLLSATTDID